MGSSPGRNGSWGWIYFWEVLYFFGLICKYCLRLSSISLTRQYRWTNKVLLHNLRPQCRRVKKSFLCRIDYRSFDLRCKGSSARRRCWQCWRRAWSARLAVCLGSWIIVPAKPQDVGCAKNDLAQGKSLALMSKKTDVREGSVKKRMFSLWHFWSTLPTPSSLFEQVGPLV